MLNLIRGGKPDRLRQAMQEIDRDPDASVRYDRTLADDITIAEHARHDLELARARVDELQSYYDACRKIVADRVEALGLDLHCTPHGPADAEYSRRIRED